MDTILLTAKRILLSALLGASMLTTTACGSWWLPRPHKIEIQQGNLLPAAAVARITEGMTKSEVIAVLGEPVTTNHFNTQQWDYIYSLSRSGDNPEAKWLTLVFDSDRVVSIDEEGVSEPL